MFEGLPKTNLKDTQVVFSNVTWRPFEVPLALPGLPTNAFYRASFSQTMKDLEPCVSMAAGSLPTIRQSEGLPGGPPGRMPGKSQGAARIPKTL